MHEFILKYRKYIIFVILLIVIEIILLSLYNKKAPASSLDKIDEKITLIANSQEKIITVVNDMSLIMKTLAKNDSIMNIQLLHYPAQQPIALGNITRVSSVYQQRIDPITKEARFHWGIDYVANKGTPVLATASGTVVESSYNTAYGNEIIIDHRNGYQSLYAHLDTIYVWAGEMIDRGEIIGEVGHTGRATGNHLHYEVSLLAKRIDPNIFR